MLRLITLTSTLISGYHRNRMFNYTLNEKNGSHVFLFHWWEAKQRVQTWHNYPWLWVSLTWLLYKLKLWHHGCWFRKFTVCPWPIRKELEIQSVIIDVSIYTLSDLGVLSNLIGSLSLANEHYSPPTEWIMRKPNKNKMASVNSRFASVSESIFNGFLLKMLLRSLPVYILKQLFFSISVNSGRIFTSPLRGSVNILPLFTSISKNNC